MPSIFYWLYIALIAAHSLSLKCQCAQKLEIYCVSHLIKLVLHKKNTTNQDTLKAIDVTHPTDMNFHLNFLAVMKCQDNFKFKVTNYNTFALKIYIQFIEFSI